MRAWQHRPWKGGWRHTPVRLFDVSENTVSDLQHWLLMTHQHSKHYLETWLQCVYLHSHYNCIYSASVISLWGYVPIPGFIKLFRSMRWSFTVDRQRLKEKKYIYMCNKSDRKKERGISLTQDEIVPVVPLPTKSLRPPHQRGSSTHTPLKEGYEAAKMNKSCGTGNLQMRLKKDPE